MKRNLIALMVALTLCAWVNGQNQTSTLQNSITVIGVDSANVDSAEVNDDSVYVHRSTNFSMNVSDDDFQFGNFVKTMGGTIVIATVAIVLVFGLPVFIIFLIFFFRYKNRRARYRLAEQALSAGQPLPEGLIKECKPTDQYSVGIKNTFTGIGLFIFLWAITGEFGIGAIGLLVMFMGIGQWLIGYMNKNGAKDEKGQ